jgi:hypothetical protein
MAPLHRHVLALVERANFRRSVPVVSQESRYRVASAPNC